MSTIWGYYCLRWWFSYNFIKSMYTFFVSLMITNVCLPNLHLFPLQRILNHRLIILYCKALWANSWIGAIYISVLLLQAPETSPLCVANRSRSKPPSIQCVHFNHHVVALKMWAILCSLAQQIEAPPLGIPGKPLSSGRPWIDWWPGSRALCRWSCRNSSRVWIPIDRSPCANILRVMQKCTHNFGNM